MIRNNKCLADKDAPAIVIDTTAWVLKIDETYLTGDRTKLINELVRNMDDEGPKEPCPVLISFLKKKNPKYKPKSLWEEYLNERSN